MNEKVYQKYLTIILFLFCVCFVLSLVVSKYFIFQIPIYYIAIFDYLKLFSTVVLLWLGLYANYLKIKPQKKINRPNLFVCIALVFLIFSFCSIIFKYKMMKNVVNNTDYYLEIEIPESSIFENLESAIKYYYKTGEESLYLTNKGEVKRFCPIELNKSMYKIKKSYLMNLFYYRSLLLTYITVLILTVFFLIFLSVKSRKEPPGASLNN